MIIRLAPSSIHSLSQTSFCKPPPALKQCSRSLFISLVMAGSYIPSLQSFHAAGTDYAGMRYQEGRQRRGGVVVMKNGNATSSGPNAMLVTITVSQDGHLVYDFGSLVDEDMMMSRPLSRERGVVMPVIVWRTPPSSTA